ncbi:MAG: hypothetical protein IH963_04850 [Chloroflexi bacterium]|nr:hypothetical protein [Chloroflexota bacterium]
MKRLTKFQFQAFRHPERPPIFQIVDEREWYCDDLESTLGVLFRDKVDNDWAYVILQQDHDSTFSCVAIDSSIKTETVARETLLSELDRASTELSETGKTDVRANLSRSINRIDPFLPVVPLAKRNPLFNLIAEHGAYSPARGMIREVHDTFVDLDGNFIEQFQTTGFDARIWELYLRAYLVDSEFSVLPTNRPDFVVSKSGITLGIEAVTANETQSLNSGDWRNIYSATNAKLLNDRPIPLDAAFVDKEQNFVPIKLGSALYSKLQKRYWNLDVMKNRPIVLAIETFHDQQALHYSSAALGTYLYGYRHEVLWDSEGKLLIVPRKIDSHTYAGKTIPSGFFSLPDAEHIGAVLFSNSGTLSKFNRMGQQGRHHNPRIRLIRKGICYNPDPQAVNPSAFVYEVGDPQFTEWWGQGLEMFHNPFAINPVSRWLFPEITHHRFENGMIYTESPEFQPIASITMNFSGESQRPLAR